jgi:hypothetical protein
VYFIIEKGCDGFVKIGKTKQGSKRQGGLNTGNRRKLEILYTIDGGYTNVERDIHREYEKYRTGDGGKEWFKLSHAQCKEIRDRYQSMIYKLPRFDEQVEPIHIPKGDKPLSMEWIHANVPGINETTTAYYARYTAAHKKYTNYLTGCQFSILMRDLGYEYNPRPSGGTWRFKTHP